MSSNWDEQDFVFEFPKGSRPSRYAISIVQTRHDIWMDVKQRVIIELQKWRDAGWEPIGEIDESGLRWRPYQQMHIEPIGLALVILVLGILLVIMDLLSPRECEEVTEFRIRMRRLKS